MRIGHGYDAHCFSSGDHVIIGGVRIPFTHGLQAHSDGDVALHALCDALLGAAGLGDIGRWFPDSDRQFADIDSRILLRDVVRKLHDRHLQVNNVDLTLIAEAPKMAPYIEAMCANIAADLAVATSYVNIKATTTEGMGFVGRREGIACHAVVLLGQFHDNG